MQALRAALIAVFFLLFNAAAQAAGKPKLVCFGDSITAGHGLSLDQAYPAVLARDLAQLGYSYDVENRGTSGATTKDAAGSVSSILNEHPEVVIVEFGGNDGLRGFPLDQTRKNLDRVLTKLAAAHVRVLLAGITLPPNYGADYVRQFDSIFTDLAAAHHVALVPMIYKDLINVPGTIQQDGIHPTAKGSEIIAKTLLPVLKPLLKPEAK